MKAYKLLAAVLGLTAGTMSASALAAGVDPVIPAYEKASGVSGNISSVGSDTLANLITFWTEDFKRLYPNVNIQVQAAGSATAPPALTEGTSNLGPMSRAMKDNEIAAFERKNGYKPTEIKVAIDALAVYVNKDNPIKGLTIPQVDAVFSTTRKCGAAADVSRWGDLGQTGDWAKRPVQLYGRNSVSGTYGFFKEHALCKGDFSSTVNEQPGSAAVVQAVTGALSGIGYSGLGYKTSGVRAVPLAKKDGANYVEANEENALNGTYPLTRYLYIYINKDPSEPLQPIVREFLKVVLSQQGQQTVVKDGYIPLPASVIEKELAKLQ